MSSGSSSLTAGARSLLAGELHMTAGEIEGLSETEAVDLVHEHWARER